MYLLMILCTHIYKHTTFSSLNKYDFRNKILKPLYNGHYLWSRDCLLYTGFILYLFSSCYIHKTLKNKKS